jgi:hypothetical protein
MKFSRCHKKGQAFVEFAASVLVLTLFGFAAVDLSKGISTYQRMNSVGREGGRVFLKSTFDTAHVSDTVLWPQVKTKVYDLLKQAMLPDDLDTNGAVRISVGRRVIQEGQTESSSATDQIIITHEFVFNSGANAPSADSRISPTSLVTRDGASVKVIAGPPVSTADDPATTVNEDTGFVPIDTLREGEELIIVEMFYKFEFMTPVEKLAPGLHLDVLYDRTVF